MSADIEKNTLWKTILTWYKNSHHTATLIFSISSKDLFRWKDSSCSQSTQETVEILYEEPAEKAGHYSQHSACCSEVVQGASFSASYKFPQSATRRPTLSMARVGSRSPVTGNEAGIYNGILREFSASLQEMRSTRPLTFLLMLLRQGNLLSLI